MNITPMHVAWGSAAQPGEINSSHFLLAIGPQWPLHQKQCIEEYYYYYQPLPSLHDELYSLRMFSTCMYYAINHGAIT